MVIRGIANVKETLECKLQKQQRAQITKEQQNSVHESGTDDTFENGHAAMDTLRQPVNISSYLDCR